MKNAYALLNRQCTLSAQTQNKRTVNCAVNKPKFDQYPVSFFYSLLFSTKERLNLYLSKASERTTDIFISGLSCKRKIEIKARELLCKK